MASLDLLYMERIDANRRMARFYAVRVERTLFGEWAVIYHWGRIGACGRRQEDWLASWDDAAIAVDRKLRQKMTRGYIVKYAGLCGSESNDAVQ